MPMPANPPQNESSPFASFHGDHVALRVKDLEAARNWYVEKLDFRVLQSWTGMGLSWAYLSPACDDDFHLELTGGPVEHDKPVRDTYVDSLQDAGYAHFGLVVDDVDAALEELQNRGVPVALPVMENPEISRRLAFVRDPWGNMIEFLERTPGALA